MRSGPFWLPALPLVAVFVAGCVTPALKGQAALSRGHYAEAAERFEEAVAADPDEVQALVGLGISRYRLGGLEEAKRPLAQAVTQAPELPIARLYLGLVALQTGDDGGADEHLGALLRLAPHPRVADHVERTLRMLRGDGVTGEMRAYMAASLDDEASLAWELADTRRALRESELRRLTDERIIFVAPRCRC
ncbi:MAG TPA: tetratricopeptide repeat protein [Methylomirabilota bacterium]|nr:tetratricopeptide repeat protein [Methylomirabilota bacterium]